LTHRSPPLSLTSVRLELMTERFLIGFHESNSRDPVTPFARDLYSCAPSAEPPPGHRCIEKLLRWIREAWHDALRLPREVSDVSSRKPRFVLSRTARRSRGFRGNWRLHE